jgi:transposase
VTDFLQDHPQGVILSLDQISLYFQATLTRVWAPIGQTPIVQVSPQRDHVHFYGALEVRNGRDIALPVAEQNSTITANFLCLLLLLFPTQPILLLLDRAPWHFGAEIDQIVAENERLALMYYPTACPELNPQEHVWSQTRQHISHNHRYRRFPALIDAFETYLNETPFATDFMRKYAPAILCEF